METNMNYQGANVADFGEEFGKHAGDKAMNGRGSDNSEIQANASRSNPNWNFTKPSDSSMGSASDGTKDSIKQNVKYNGDKGINFTQSYGTDNFN